MNEIDEILNIPPPPPNEDIENLLNVTKNLHSKSSKFNSEIRRLGVEMHTLQQQSESIHKRLLKRESAMNQIAPIITPLIIPAEVVNAIEKGELNQEWVDAVNFLKLKVPKVKSRISEDFNELRHSLLMLAVNSSKTFFVMKLRSLRRPGADAALIHQSMLNFVDPAFDLLQTNSPKLAQSLKLAYINTMKWYYQMLLGKYGRFISRQPCILPDHLVLLGTTLSNSKSLKLDSFLAGARPSVLMGDKPLPLTSNQSHHVEVYVHSLLTALNFAIADEKQIVLSSDEVFTHVKGQFSDLLKSLVQKEKFDLFGLLLTVKLVSSLGKCLDTSTADELTAQCWSLIIHIIEQQSASIEQSALKVSVGSSGNVSGGPHLLTQMCSSYLCGILQLSTDIKLARPLRHLVSSYEMFISKLAQGNEAVLYSNYFVMSTLLSDLEGELPLEFASHFGLLVEAFDSAKR